MMCNRDYCTNCLAVFKFADASNLVAIRAVAWTQAWKKCVHGAEVLEELKCTVFGGEGRFEKKKEISNRLQRTRRRSEVCCLASILSHPTDD